MKDESVEIRIGEEIDLEKLNTHLKNELEDSSVIKEIRQFPGGYSNLTYLLISEDKELVLRRPPRGANIKSAHDMGREFKVLKSLNSHFPVPRPVYFTEDESVIGSPFYIMEKVNGLILRAGKPIPSEVGSSQFEKLSKATVDTLAQLHKINLQKIGLDSMGKPDGYVERQVKGWIKRYHNAQTDDIKGLSEMEDWLNKNIPADQKIAFVHNDFKYDNLVVDPNNDFRVLAVLDWEMATVGDAFMDLGTTLAYWSEADDHSALKPFNVTSLPGNRSRAQVLDYYQEITETEVKNAIFYYVFGLYKIAVIGQQIYKRFKEGLTKDARFGQLIHVINACGDTGIKALEKNRISSLQV
ncbi:MAG: phosphotransferase family protein [Bacteroidota bacterium]